MSTNFRTASIAARWPDSTDFSTSSERSVVLLTVPLAPLARAGALPARFAVVRRAVFALALGAAFALALGAAFALALGAAFAEAAF